MLKIQKQTGLFLFTVETIEGFQIEEYFGLVAGSRIYGANFIKDYFARIADKVGGRAKGYETALDDSVDGALLEMATKAAKLGANAVIGIDVDTSAVGKMLLASCYGTAVRFKRMPTAQL